MTQKQTHHVPGISDGLKKADVPLSVVVQANGMLYLSGMPPLDPSSGKILTGLDISEQTRACLEAIRHALTSAGSSMDKVVSIRVYCTDPAQFGKVNEVYRQYFTDAHPARTFIPVCSWGMGFDIELECVALP